MRWVCATALSLACWFGCLSASAQEEVGWGGLSMVAYPGYSFYALPVANFGLAKDWVKSSELKWQIGYNYSVVPVRIEFEHRLPNAFKGRIEVETLVSFYPEESATNFPAVYSQDILVPPSVRQTYMFAPRVCPPSEPGAPIELTVRLFKDGMKQPLFSNTTSVIQLEPAYLYSLWLDGPKDPNGTPAVLKNSINPNNTRGLQLPKGYEAANSILSSKHFLISVDRQQVTKLPLAARDFAFVVADLEQVRKWDETEQQALVSFMVGGGHLCLFNASGQTWQGLKTASPSPTGRGMFVPVRGGAEQAREMVTSWLEGELEEFVIWAGGTSSGWGIDKDSFSGSFGTKLRYISAMAKESPGQPVLSHRPGYLNPIWVYREACRSGATEPWESPSTLLGIPSPSSKDTRTSAAFLDGGSGQVTQLSHLALPFRSFPISFAFLLGALPLLAVFLAQTKKSRLGAAAVFGFALVFGLVAVIGAKANLPGQASLVLVDADSRCKVGSLRQIVSANASSDGWLVANLPPNPLLRHVSWDSPSSWEVEQTKVGGVWRARGDGSQVTLASDSVSLNNEDLPVKVQVRKSASGVLVCEIDSRALSAASTCLVQLPMGWILIQGGGEVKTISLQFPSFPQYPGKKRLQAWVEFYKQISSQGQNNLFEITGEVRLARQFFEEQEIPLDIEGQLNRFGWIHLTGFPNGMPGAMQTQGVVLVDDLRAQADQNQKGRGVTFWRITFPLGEGQ